MEMHERIFGVALDLTSAFVQREVDRLIDHELFKKDGSFALSEDMRNKNHAWIEWWADNRPSSSSGGAMKQENKFNANGMDEHKAPNMFQVDNEPTAQPRQ